MKHASAPSADNSRSSIGCFYRPTTDSGTIKSYSSQVVPAVDDDWSSVRRLHRLDTTHKDEKWTWVIRDSVIRPSSELELTYLRALGETALQHRIHVSELRSLLQQLLATLVTSTTTLCITLIVRTSLTCTCVKLTYRRERFYVIYRIGGAEIASTGKCKYGKVKYKTAKCVRVENTSTEYSSTATQGWKKQVRKIQVRVSRVGKCKYRKIMYEITMQLLEIRLK